MDLKEIFEIVRTLEIDGIKLDPIRCLWMGTEAWDRLHELIGVRKCDQSAGLLRLSLADVPAYRSKTLPPRSWRFFRGRTDADSYPAEGGELPPTDPDDARQKADADGQKEALG